MQTYIVNICTFKQFEEATHVTDQCSKFLNGSKNLDIHFHCNLYKFKQDPVLYKVLYLNHVNLHMLLIHVSHEN